MVERLEDEFHRGMENIYYAAAEHGSRSWGRWDAHGAPPARGSHPKPCRRSERLLTEGSWAAWQTRSAVTAVSLTNSCGFRVPPSAPVRIVLPTSPPHKCDCFSVTDIID